MASTYKSEDANYAKIHSVQWYNKYNRFIVININISFFYFFKRQESVTFFLGGKKCSYLNFQHFFVNCIFKIGLVGTSEA
jgi:hypothetical protein